MKIDFLVSNTQIYKTKVKIFRKGIEKISINFLFQNSAGN